ncbi:MAG: NfeD family protein [Treponema sp.]|nr:NfeD family protein [Treponema sp.]
MDFSFWVLNNLPWFWLGVTVLCIIIEGISLGTLTSIWFGCGAFVMIFLSFLPIPFRFQLLIFVVTSLVLLIFTRPFAVKKLKVKKTPTNSDSLIGKKVLVTEKITELQKGTVKVNGVIWSAKSEDNTPIEKGAECIVTAIEGVTLAVKKI